MPYRSRTLRSRAAAALVPLTSATLLLVLTALASCKRQGPRRQGPAGPPAALPAAPTSLAGFAVTSSQISLHWTDNADNEQGYRIEECAGGGCMNFVDIGYVPGNAMQTFERSASTNYGYRVRAFNDAGTSGYSNIVRVWTPGWTTKAYMPTPRVFPAAAVVNGILYVVGGRGPFGLVHALEAYDPLTNSWATKAPMPSQREAATAAVVNGIIYVMGGYGPGVGDQPTVEAYDPATDTWTTKAPMPTARTGAAAGVINGIIYVAGGQPAGTNVAAYDPATNTWTAKAPLPQPRQYGAAGVWAGRLYIAGGEDNGTALSTVVAYDPALNSWMVQGATMAPPRSRGRYGARTALGRPRCRGGGQRGGGV